MNLDDIDLTKKENQTFKNWFKVMWSNSYIFLFFLGIAFIIVMALSTFDDNLGYLILLIPISSCSVIAYKGFYQFWNDLKKGQSR